MSLISRRADRANLQEMVNEAVRGKFTGFCAGCRVKFLIGDTVQKAVVIDVDGTSAFCCLCRVCARRAQTDDKFRERLENDGYRSAHGAGPDDVGGAA